MLKDKRNIVIKLGNEFIIVFIKGSHSANKNSLRYYARRYISRAILSDV
tara:strand:- start:391 stop:537 length:147 start_codon:yes stop_codon:yes gene_type:complete